MPRIIYTFRSFTTAAFKHPAWTFWIFWPRAFRAVDGAVAALTSPNAPLDVIEGYAWGHEWPLGTYKHPPLQAWILQLCALATDRAWWAHFFSSASSRW